MASRRHLEWSRPIDVHRWSDHQSNNAAAEQIYAEIAAIRRERGGRIREPAELRKHIKVFVLDLWLAARERAPGSRRPVPRWLGISRAKGDYNGPESRYRRLFLSYDHVIGTLDDLIRLGYVKQVIGFYDRRTGIGKQTRIRARSKLLRLMDGYAVSKEDIYRVPSETIILRNAEGEEIEYEDTEETVRWRENLARINAKLSTLRIRLYVTDEEFKALNERMTNDPERGPIDYGRSQLVRIFNNGSFREGGRFYGGWWQAIPREYRKYLDINHKGTVEYDYSGVHIRMLYGMVGLEPPDDPYDLPGMDRDHQKRLLLTMINASSRDQALRAFRNRPEFRDRMGGMMDRLAERHTPIQQYFYTGEGIKLQYRDSCIAERVMLKMLDVGRYVLPVHDSFIMRIGLERELVESMEQAFTEEFPGLKPSLKAKETALEELSRQREDQGSDEGDWRAYVVTDDISELMAERNARSEFYRD